jgi:uncharacterized protein YndB with AHSA1/START domain
VRKSIKVEHALAASAQAVWKLISEGAAVERWFEWVAETQLNDAGEGGMRVIRMKDGTAFDEYITLNDARSSTYQYYAPDPPLPIKHVIGTKRIERGATPKLVWFVTFELTVSAPHDIVLRMTELYQHALQRIDELALHGG